MKTTPFTEKHIALGAKMHEFAGYNMPIESSLKKPIFAGYCSSTVSRIFFEAYPKELSSLF